MARQMQFIQANRYNQPKVEKKKNKFVNAEKPKEKEANGEKFMRMLAEELKRRKELGLDQPHMREDITIRQAGTLGINYNKYKEELFIKRRSERFGRGYSMGYILLTEANDLLDECEHGLPKEYLEEYGVSELIHQADEIFLKIFAKIKPFISVDEMRTFNSELKEFDENVRNYCHLEGYRSATEKDIRDSARNRIKNLHREIVEKGCEYKEKYGQEALQELWAELKAIDDQKEKE